MLGVVVGLAAEARLARGLGGTVAVGGGGAAGAASAVQALLDAGATALVSFGLTGGLAPGLPAGAIVVPAAVVDGQGGRWDTDPGLNRWLGGASGLLLGGAGMIVTEAAKTAAWDASGALAVDLESAAVARAARVPFAVLRAVCDPAGRSLPPAAQTALDAQGRIRPLALIQSLTRHPRQIGALIALGREAAQARRALLAHVARIGAYQPG